MNKLLTILIVFLTGCGTFNTPEIQKGAKVDFWTNDDRSRIDVGIKVKIKHADLTEWYYYCRDGGIWDMIDENPNTEGIQQDVVKKEVLDGIAYNRRKDIRCRSMLGVKIVAYNNPGSKIAEKTSSMLWEVDLEYFIAKHAASKIKRDSE